MAKVIVFGPYPKGIAPSQRFRIEMFLNSSEGIQFDLKSFWSEKSYLILYQKGGTLTKAIALLSGFIKRFLHVLQAIGYDFVLIHREASPIGPPIFEWMLRFIFRKKIIFDFDDAIWMVNTSEANSIAGKLKWHKKFQSICKWSYKISAGNAFLGEKAMEFNDNVIVIPTAVDTRDYHIPAKVQSSDHRLTIGWTGSHSTLPYLKPIIPLIEELSEAFDFRFLVISNKEPEFQLKNLEFRNWSKSTEILDLAEIDIGIMPLPLNDWSRGKCGFKIIQYLAMEIPSIATDISPNNLIINQKQNGFLCRTEEDWKDALKQLLEDAVKRKEYGQQGRIHIIKNYSKESQQKAFNDLFASDTTRY